MGNPATKSADPEAAKVVVLFDQDSPSGCGQKSVLSQPLDDFLDFESLWAGLMKLCREPPKVGLLTGTKTTDVSETEFLCTHKFSVGSVGALFGFEDFETQERCSFDLSKGELCTTRYDHEGCITQTTWTQLHRDPLRVESWLEMPQYRSSGRVVALMAHANVSKARWLKDPDNPIPSDFSFTPDSESLDGSGLKSVVSDPLDDYFADLEELWDGWIKAIKTKSPPVAGNEKAKALINTLSSFVKDLSVPEVSSFEVKEISESEFNIITTFDGVSLDKGFNFLQRMFSPVDHVIAMQSTGDKKSVGVYVCDRSAAEITCQTFNDSGLLVAETYTKFYENPLRVEVWAEQCKSRKAGRLLCMVVWTFLHEIIKGLRAAGDDAGGEVAEVFG